MDYVRKYYGKEIGQMAEHRYVWTQAHGEIPKGMEIHHINSIKNDNRLENLKLVTHKENHRQSDKWGKGWSYAIGATRPYRSMRLGKYLGNYGTACGAYMANRMFFIKTVV
jgi:hypothetical protein